MLDRIANAWEPKGLVIVLSIFRHFMTNSHTIAQSDPYAPFPVFETFENNGKHKGHPVTPEPSSFGFFFCGLCLLLLLFRMSKRK